MTTPVEETEDDKMRIRLGFVRVSDGKSRPRPARLRLTMESVTVQLEAPPTQPPIRDKGSGPNVRDRMVQVNRQRIGGLGLSIKGGSEHKLPVLISKIYKDQAADQTGQLFVGDAVIKVNGEYITSCTHDEAVKILRNAGDIVVLTVRHYRSALPFLQKQAEGTSDTDSSAGDDHPSQLTTEKSDKTSEKSDTVTPTNNNNSNGNHEAKDDNAPSLNGVWQTAPGIDCTEESLTRPASAAGSVISSRPPSVVSESTDTPLNTVKTDWIDTITVPLMMGYVTRYVCGTDKLRPAAFEVYGASGISTGVLHCDDDPAAMSRWLKCIGDNIVGLTNLQMKLYNRNFAPGERIEYMGWVHEGVLQTSQPWQTYKPRFLVLKGTEVMLYDSPPITAAGLRKCPESLKVYQTMFRVVKETETVDWRQHCFLVQSSGTIGIGSNTGPRYFSVETRQDLLRVEAAWTAAIVNSVSRLGKKTFTVVYGGRAAGLTLDWASGFSLTEGGTQGSTPIWSYRFSQLRGSSDDGKSRLKLHFQDVETKVIETKELECQILQSLLYCMHAFLTAKVASVDPAFLSSIQSS